MPPHPDPPSKGWRKNDSGHVTEHNRIVSELNRLDDLVNWEYVHTQNSPAGEWVINHGLNGYPSVTTVDSGGNIVEGHVVFLDKNNIKISFNGSFAGEAYFS